MSYEKFVMDTDVSGALHAYLNGVKVNEDTLGFDALAEHGPGEHLALDGVCPSEFDKFLEDEAGVIKRLSRKHKVPIEERMAKAKYALIQCEQSQDG